MICELAPPASLARHVDAIWFSSGSGSTRVLPDGCADLIFDLDRGRAEAVGTMTKPLFVDAPGNCMGVRFRPGYAATAFRAPLSEFTDASIPQRDLGILASRLAESGSAETRVTLIGAAFRDGGSPDRRVLGAIDCIVQSGGRRSMEEICRDIGISRQHLARLFAHHVGIAPKTFARIARFRRALSLARTERWSALVAELGYFDQSHLIAEFREFAGENPVPFFQSR